MFDLISHVVFILIFALSLVDLARYRDRARLEVAALFGTLAIVMAVDAVGRVLGKPDPWIQFALAIILVAQPYLLLRLVHHFEHVPKYQHVAAMGLLGASWLALAGGGNPLAGWASAVIVVAFLYVEGYAAVVLLRAATSSAGNARRRMIAAAVGSFCLAGAILAAGAGLALPRFSERFSELASLLAVGSAVGYYLAFAPPRWLRRAMQMTEFRNFVLGLGKTPAEQRLDAALEYLGPAAASALNARGVILAMGQQHETSLAVLADGPTRKALAVSRIDRISLGRENPLLHRAWSLQKPVLASDTSALGPDLRDAARSIGGAESCIVAPFELSSGVRGLVIAFLARPLFLEDDLELLSLMAQQCALAIEEGQIYLDSQRRSTEREILLYLVQSVAREVESSAIMNRLVAQMQRLVTCHACSLMLPQADGSFVVAATAGTAGTARLGNVLPAGSSLAGRAMAAREPVLVPDISQEPWIKTVSEDSQSMLAVPILDGEQVHGVLNFQSKDLDAFGPSQVATAQIVAAHAEVALSRARLFEEIRARNDELERANRTKSEFLANMSHELRTPLNAIIGFSELLIDEPDGGYDKETCSAYMETIHESGQHLLALINDILDLSKVEAGRMELFPESIAVAEAVRHVVRTVEPLLAQKHITLEADHVEAGWLTADEGKLKQILINLLSNAIKFTEEGGRVTVTAERQDGSVCFTVADTGLGIAQEDQQRIFEEFQQVDSGPGRRFEGTGLGLALTRRLVELHGGRIWLESELGKGSSFYVEMPVGAEDDSAEPDPQPAPLRLQPRPVSDRPLVLIVEDDARSANLLAVYLHGGGYRSEVAGDGQQALTLAEQLQPMAITLDVMLPDLEGWEVLRILKENEATRDIPVAIVSVVDDSHLGYALGATDYFVKPIDRRALLRWLERRARRPELAHPAVRILVVDDEASARDLLAGMLAPAGYDVVLAADGREGLARAREARPDVILLDLMMPGLSGFDVVSELKSQPTTAEIPILIVTAKEVTPEERALLNGHVAAILQKGALPAVELITWLRHAVPAANSAEETLYVAG
jgi:signal transduction histidine kinase/CheY-like chemotaxis protein